MKKLLILVLAAILAPAAMARVRVIHHPAIPCTFSLLPAWGTAQVPAAGMTRGIVFVYGQTAECAQWTGYSDVDWVTIEAAPMDAQPAAYVTVAPNPTAETRTTTVIVAGIRLALTQEAGTPVARNTNLLQNGTFDTNLAHWTWYDRFPNGRGAAAWSPLDANDRFTSGSIALRADGISLAFQQLQCIPALKSTNYRFGAKVRTGSTTNRGEGIMGVFTYASPDCSGDFTKQQVEALNPSQPAKWEEFSFTTTTGSRTQSLLVVIASSAEVPPFDTSFDDVFVRLEP